MKTRHMVLAAVAVVAAGATAQAQPTGGSRTPDLGTRMTAQQRSNTARLLAEPEGFTFGIGIKGAVNAGPRRLPASAFSPEGTRANTVAPQAAARRGLATARASRRPPLELFEGVPSTKQSSLATQPRGATTEAVRRERP